MSIMKIFTIFGIVGKWYDKAMADGEVTLAEGVELIISLAGVIGLNVAPDVTALVKSTASDVIDAVDDAVDTLKDEIDNL